MIENINHNVMDMHRSICNIVLHPRKTLCTINAK